MGGMAAFSVPTSNKKPGTGATGAGGADGDELERAAGGDDGRHGGVLGADFEQEAGHGSNGRGRR